MGFVRLVVLSGHDDVEESVYEPLVDNQCNALGSTVRRVTMKVLRL